MAIDTAEKRASVFGTSGCAQICHRVDFVSGINAADRRHTVDSYRGIAAAAPAGTVLAVLERCFFRFMSGGMWRRIN